jgi:hypothetical protein
LVFQVVAGDLTAFAIKDEVVGSVPVLNDVEAFLNLLAQRLRVQILAEEDRLDRFAQLGAPALPRRCTRISSATR